MRGDLAVDGPAYPVGRFHSLGVRRHCKSGVQMDAEAAEGAEDGRPPESQVVSAPGARVLPFPVPPGPPKLSFAQVGLIVSAVVFLLVTFLDLPALLTGPDDLDIPYACTFLSGAEFLSCLRSAAAQLRLKATRADPNERAAMLRQADGLEHLARSALEP